MKIRRFLSAFLAFVLTVNILPLSAMAAQTNPGKTVLQNEYIKVTVDNKTGRFGIRTVEGQPVRKNDQDTNLTFRGDDPETSFTTFRINGTDYIFGNPYDLLGLTIKSELGETTVQTSQSKAGLPEGCRAICTPWSVEGVTITQVLLLYPETDDENTGNLSIYYEVDNKSGAQVELGARILLDTMVGANDGPEFQIGTIFSNTLKVERTLTREPTGKRGVSFRDDSNNYYLGQGVSVENANYYTLPGYWVMKDTLDPTNPLATNVIAYGYTQLADAGFRALDYLTVGHWNRMANTKWDYEVDPNLDFTRDTNDYGTADSAVAFYWEPQTVAPRSSTLRLGTVYGLGEIIDPTSVLSITLPNPTTMMETNDDESAYIDQQGYGAGVFDVNVVVENLALYDMKHDKIDITLQLESGLRFVRKDSQGNTMFGSDGKPLMTYGATQTVSYAKSLTPEQAEAGVKNPILPGDRVEVSFRVVATGKPWPTTRQYLVTATSPQLEQDFINKYGDSAGDDVKALYCASRADFVFLPAVGKGTPSVAYSVSPEEAFDKDPKYLTVRMSNIEAYNAGSTVKGQETSANFDLYLKEIVTGARYRVKVEGNVQTQITDDGLTGDMRISYQGGDRVDAAGNIVWLDEFGNVVNVPLGTDGAASGYTYQSDLGPELPVGEYCIEVDYKSTDEDENAMLDMTTTQTFAVTTNEAARIREPAILAVVKETVDVSGGDVLSQMTEAVDNIIAQATALKAEFDKAMADPSGYVSELIESAYTEMKTYAKSLASPFLELKNSITQLADFSDVERLKELSQEYDQLRDVDWDALKDADLTQILQGFNLDLSLTSSIDISKIASGIGGGIKETALAYAEQIAQPFLDVKKDILNITNITDVKQLKKLAQDYEELRDVDWSSLEDFNLSKLIKGVDVNASLDSIKFSEEFQGKIDTVLAGFNPLNIDFNLFAESKESNSILDLIKDPGKMVEKVVSSIGDSVQSTVESYGKQIENSFASLKKDLWSIADLSDVNQLKKLAQNYDELKDVNWDSLKNFDLSKLLSGGLNNDKLTLDGLLDKIALSDELAGQLNTLTLGLTSLNKGGSATIDVSKLTEDPSGAVGKLLKGIVDGAVEYAESFGKSFDGIKTDLLSILDLSNITQLNKLAKDYKELEGVDWSSLETFKPNKLLNGVSSNAALDSIQFSAEFQAQLDAVSAGFDPLGVGADALDGVSFSDLINQPLETAKKIFNNVVDTAESYAARITEPFDGVKTELLSILDLSNIQQLQELAASYPELEGVDWGSLQGFKLNDLMRGVDPKVSLSASLDSVRFSDAFQEKLDAAMGGFDPFGIGASPIQGMSITKIIANPSEALEKLTESIVRGAESYADSLTAPIEDIKIDLLSIMDLSNIQHLQELAKKSADPALQGVDWSGLKDFELSDLLRGVNPKLSLSASLDGIRFSDKFQAKLDAVAAGFDPFGAGSGPMRNVSLTDIISDPLAAAEKIIQGLVDTAESYVSAVTTPFDDIKTELLSAADFSDVQQLKELANDYEELKDVDWSALKGFSLDDLLVGVDPTLSAQASIDGIRFSEEFQAKLDAAAGGFDPFGLGAPLQGVSISDLVSDPSTALDKVIEGFVGTIESYVSRVTSPVNEVKNDLLSIMDFTEIDRLEAVAADYAALQNVDWTCLKDFDLSKLLEGVDPKVSLDVSLGSLKFGGEFQAKLDAAAGGFDPLGLGAGVMQGVTLTDLINNPTAAIEKILKGVLDSAGSGSTQLDAPFDKLKSKLLSVMDLSDTKQLKTLAAKTSVQGGAQLEQASVMALSSANLDEAPSGGGDLAGVDWSTLKNFAPSDLLANVDASASSGDLPEQIRFNKEFQQDIDTAKAGFDPLGIGASAVPGVSISEIMSDPSSAVDKIVEGIVKSAESGSEQLTTPFDVIANKLLSVIDPVNPADLEKLAQPYPVLRGVNWSTLSNLQLSELLKGIAQGQSGGVSLSNVKFNADFQKKIDAVAAGFDPLGMGAGPMQDVSLSDLINDPSAALDKIVTGVVDAAGSYAAQLSAPFEGVKSELLSILDVSDITQLQALAGDYTALAGVDWSSLTDFSLSDLLVGVDPSLSLNASLDGVHFKDDIQKKLDAVAAGFDPFGIGAAPVQGVSISEIMNDPSGAVDKITQGLVKSAETYADRLSAPFESIRSELLSILDVSDVTQLQELAGDYTALAGVDWSSLADFELSDLLAGVDPSASLSASLDGIGFSDAFQAKLDAVKAGFDPLNMGADLMQGVSLTELINDPGAAMDKIAAGIVESAQSYATQLIAPFDDVKRELLSILDVSNAEQLQALAQNYDELKNVDWSSLSSFKLSDLLAGVDPSASLSVSLDGIQFSQKLQAQIDKVKAGFDPLNPSYNPLNENVSFEQLIKNPTKLINLKPEDFLNMTEINRWRGEVDTLLEMVTGAFTELGKVVSGEYGVLDGPAKLYTLFTDLFDVAYAADVSASANFDALQTNVSDALSNNKCVQIFTAVYLRFAPAYAELNNRLEMVNGVYEKAKAIPAQLEKLMKSPASLLELDFGSLLNADWFTRWFAAVKDVCDELQKVVDFAQKSVDGQYDVLTGAQELYTLFTDLFDVRYTADVSASANFDALKENGQNLAENLNDSANESIKLFTAMFLRLEKAYSAINGKVETFKSVYHTAKSIPDTVKKLVSNPASLLDLDFTALLNGTKIGDWLAAVQAAVAEVETIVGRLKEVAETGDAVEGAQKLYTLFTDLFDVRYTADVSASANFDALKGNAQNLAAGLNAGANESVKLFTAMFLRLKTAYESVSGKVETARSLYETAATLSEKISKLINNPASLLDFDFSELTELTWFTGWFDALKELYAEADKVVAFVTKVANGTFNSDPLSGAQELCELLNGIFDIPYLKEANTYLAVLQGNQSVAGVLNDGGHERAKLYVAMFLRLQTVAEVIKQTVEAAKLVYEKIVALLSKIAELIQNPLSLMDIDFSGLLDGLSFTNWLDAVKRIYERLQEIAEFLKKVAEGAYNNVVEGAVALYELLKSLFDVSFLMDVDLNLQELIEAMKKGAQAVIDLLNDGAHEFAKMVVAMYMRLKEMLGSLGGLLDLIMGILDTLMTLPELLLKLLKNPLELLNFDFGSLLDLSWFTGWFDSLKLLYVDLQSIIDRIIEVATATYENAVEGAQALYELLKEIFGFSFTADASASMSASMNYDKLAENGIQQFLDNPDNEYVKLFTAMYLNLKAVYVSVNKKVETAKGLYEKVSVLPAKVKELIADPGKVLNIDFASLLKGATFDAWSSAIEEVKSSDEVQQVVDFAQSVGSGDVIDGAQKLYTLFTSIFDVRYTADIRASANFDALKGNAQNLAANLNKSANKCVKVFIAMYLRMQDAANAITTKVELAQSVCDKVQTIPALLTKFTDKPESLLSDIDFTKIFDSGVGWFTGWFDSAKALYDEVDTVAAFVKDVADGKYGVVEGAQKLYTLFTDLFDVRYSVSVSASANFDAVKENVNNAVTPLNDSANKGVLLFTAMYLRLREVSGVITDTVHTATGVYDKATGVFNKIKGYVTNPSSLTNIVTDIDFSALLSLEPFKNWINAVKDIYAQVQEVVDFAKEAYNGNYDVVQGAQRLYELFNKLFKIRYTTDMQVSADFGALQKNAQGVYADLDSGANQCVKIFTAMYLRLKTAYGALNEKVESGRRIYNTVVAIPDRLLKLVDEPSSLLNFDFSEFVNTSWFTNWINAAKGIYSKVERVMDFAKKAYAGELDVVDGAQELYALFTEIFDVNYTAGMKATANFDALQKNAQGAYDGLSSSANECVKIFTAMYLRLAAVYSSVNGKVETAKGIYDKVVLIPDKISKLVSDPSSLLNFDAITGILESLLNIQPVQDWLNAAKNLYGTVQEVVTFARDACTGEYGVYDGAKKLYKLFNKLFKIDFSVNVDLSDLTGASLESASLENAAGDVQELASDGLMIFTAMYLRLEVVYNSINDRVESVKRVWNRGTEIVDWITELIQNPTSIFTSLTDPSLYINMTGINAWVEAIQDIYGTVQEVIDLAKKAYNGEYDNVMDGAQAVYELFTKIFDVQYTAEIKTNANFDEQVTNVQGVYDSMSDCVKIFTAMYLRMKTAYNSINNKIAAAENLYNKVRSAIDQIAGFLSNPTSIISAIKDAIFGWIDELTTSFTFITDLIELGQSAYRGELDPLEGGKKLYDFFQTYFSLNCSVNMNAADSAQLKRLNGAYGQAEKAALIFVAMYARLKDVYSGVSGQFSKVQSIYDTVTKIVDSVRALFDGDISQIASLLWEGLKTAITEAAKMIFEKFGVYKDAFMSILDQIQDFDPEALANMALKLGMQILKVQADRLLYSTVKTGLTTAASFTDPGFKFDFKLEDGLPTYSLKTFADEEEYDAYVKEMGIKNKTLDASGKPVDQTKMSLEERKALGTDGVMVKITGMIRQIGEGTGVNDYIVDTSSEPAILNDTVAFTGSDLVFTQGTLTIPIIDFDIQGAVDAAYEFIHLDGILKSDTPIFNTLFVSGNGVLTVESSGFTVHEGEWSLDFYNGYDKVLDPIVLTAEEQKAELEKQAGNKAPEDSSTNGSIAWAAVSALNDMFNPLRALVIEDVYFNRHSLFNMPSFSIAGFSIKFDNYVLRSSAVLFGGTIDLKILKGEIRNISYSSSGLDSIEADLKFELGGSLGLLGPGNDGGGEITVHHYSDKFVERIEAAGKDAPNSIYGVKFHAELQNVTKVGVEICFKKVDDGRILPDVIAFEAGLGTPGVMLYAGIFLTAVRGAIRELADSIAGGGSDMPLTIEAGVDIKFGVEPASFDGKIDMVLKLTGIEFNGSLLFKGKPFVTKAQIKAQWIKPWFMQATIDVDIYGLDILVGNAKLFIGENEEKGRIDFEGFVNAAIQIPKFVPLVGGMALAKISFGLNNDKIWGTIPIGIPPLYVYLGVIYSWGGDIEFYVNGENLPEAYTYLLLEKPEEEPVLLAIGNGVQVEATSWTNNETVHEIVCHSVGDGMSVLDNGANDVGIGGIEISDGGKKHVIPFDSIASDRDAMLEIEYYGKEKTDAELNKMLKLSGYGDIKIGDMSKPEAGGNALKQELLTADGVTRHMVYVLVPHDYCTQSMTLTSTEKVATKLMSTPITPTLGAVTIEGYEGGDDTDFTATVGVKDVKGGETINLYLTQETVGTAEVPLKDEDGEIRRDEKGNPLMVAEANDPGVLIFEGLPVSAGATALTQFIDLTNIEYGNLGDVRKLLSSGDYYLRAEMKSDLSYSAASSTTHFTMTDPFAPAATEEVALQSVGNGYFNLSFAHVPAATDYKVDFCDAEGELYGPYNGLVFSADDLKEYLNDNGTPEDVTDDYYEKLRLGGVRATGGEPIVDENGEAVLDEYGNQQYTPATGYVGLETDKVYIAKVWAGTLPGLEADPKQNVHYAPPAASKKTLLPEPVQTRLDVQLLDDEDIIDHAAVTEFTVNRYSPSFLVAPEADTNDAFTVEAYVGDALVGTADKNYKLTLDTLNSDGTYCVELHTVNQKTHDLTVSVIYVTIDTIAPTIFITSPKVGEKYPFNAVPVTGTTSPGSALTANGKTMDVASDGSFSGFVTLPAVQATATLELVATDAAGNVGQAKTTVSNGGFKTPVGVVLRKVDEELKQGDTHRLEVFLRYTKPVMTTDEAGNEVIKRDKDGKTVYEYYEEAATETDYERLSFRVTTGDAITVDADGVVTARGVGAGIVQATYAISDGLELTSAIGIRTAAAEDGGGGSGGGSTGGGSTGGGSTGGGSTGGGSTGGGSTGGGSSGGGSSGGGSTGGGSTGGGSTGGGSTGGGSTGGGSTGGGTVGGGEAVGGATSESKPVEVVVNNTAVVAQVAETGALVVSVTQPELLKNETLVVDTGKNKTDNYQITVDAAVTAQLKEKGQAINVRTELGVAELKAETLTGETVNVSLKANGEEVSKPSKKTAIQYDMALLDKGAGVTVQLEGVDTAKGVSAKVRIPDDIKVSRITDVAVVYPDGSSEIIAWNLDMEGNTAFAQIEVKNSGSVVFLSSEGYFTDVAKEHWGRSTITAAATMGYVAGKGDDKFDPESEVTSAELTTVLLRVGDQMDSAERKSFSDVKEDAWYSDYMGIAGGLGLIKEDNAKPEEEIPRLEAIALVGRQLKLLGLGNTPSSPASVLSKFADSKDIPSSAAEDIARCIASGVISGTDKNKIEPFSTLTRAEMATIIMRLDQLKEAGI